ncbi:MAG: hypothetical protein ACP5O1_01845 [Phycisphaerae bacterium]
MSERLTALSGKTVERRRGVLPSRAGVAIITAVFMMAIVGMCLAVMARSYVEQARLTAKTIARRQLSLLMDAGVQVVKMEVMEKQVPPTLQIIALPPELTRQHGRLTIRRVTAGAAVVVYQVRSRYAGLQRHALLAYDRDTRRWEIH